jgi:hypothetical protein
MSSATLFSCAMLLWMGAIAEISNRMDSNNIPALDGRFVFMENLVGCVMI